MNHSSALQFPEKVYLSGADYFHLMLDINVQKHKIGNNIIRVCLNFESEDLIKDLVQTIHHSPLIHWVSNISLVTNKLFRKPYWHYKNRNNTLTITEHYSDTEKEIPSEILDRIISLDSPCLIEFDIIRYPNKSITFLLSWHHVLMDGRGSDLLLKHLNNQLEINQKTFSDFFPQAEGEFSFLQNMKNMFEVKRFIKSTSKNTVSVANKKQKTDNRSFKLKTILFNVNQTETIDTNAKKNGARFGANIFLISCCVQLVHQINKQRGKVGAIWIPIPYDGRKRGGFGPVISNCISFLFHRISINELNSVNETVSCINSQMAEQLKNDLPKKYNALMNMMRHLPLSVYHFLIHRTGNETISSFLYTSSGEGVWDMNQLIKSPINDILIIPPYTFPPGLTFSFLRYNNTLKMNIVYCENIISQNELTLIESKINELLLGNY